MNTTYIYDKANLSFIEII